MNFSSLKIIAKIFTITGLAISTVVISNTTQAQNFYKWVDKQGSTHYTVTPPPSSARNLGKIATYNDTSSHVSQPLQQQEVNTPQPEQKPDQTPAPLANGELIVLPTEQGGAQRF